MYCFVYRPSFLVDTVSPFLEFLSLLITFDSLVMNVFGWILGFGALDGDAVWSFGDTLSFVATMDGRGGSCFSKHNFSMCFFGSWAQVAS